MWWWIGAVLLLAISVVWVGVGSVDVFRGRMAAVSLKALPLWVFHAGTGVLGMWMLLRATGA